VSVIFVQLKGTGIMTADFTKHPQYKISHNSSNMSRGVQSKLTETGAKRSEENNNRFAHLFEKSPKFEF
jgi:hypothetical protein